jgi:hypothetical protein
MKLFVRIDLITRSKQHNVKNPQKHPTHQTPRRNFANPTDFSGKT